MENSKVAFALALTGLITACGGGSGGGDKSSNDVVLEPSASTSLDGIYLGDGFEPSVGNLEFMAMVLDSKVYAISSQDIQYKGEIVPNTASDYMLSLTMYSNTDLSAFDLALVEGKYESKNFINGEYDRRFGGSGEFALEYIPELYEQPASLEQVSGTWTDANTSRPPSVTINSNGEVFGTDADGCVYSGNVRVPKSDRNLYEIGLKIESCSQYTGDYSGAGFISADATETALIVIVSNSSHSMPFTLIKD